MFQNRKLLTLRCRFTTSRSSSSRDSVSFRRTSGAPASTGFNVSSAHWPMAVSFVGGGLRHPHKRRDGRVLPVLCASPTGHAPRSLRARARADLLSAPRVVRMRFPTGARRVGLWQVGASGGSRRFLLGDPPHHAAASTAASSELFSRCHLSLALPSPIVSDRPSQRPPPPHEW